MNKAAEFLQSESWLAFQEAAGKQVVRLSGDGFSANGIIHRLPIVGRYLYVPRGPSGEISNFPASPAGGQFPISKLIEEAKKRKVGWIRIEPETEEMLEMIRKETETIRQALLESERPRSRRQGDNLKVVKAPHDVQPKEVLVIDIAKSEEELLAAMKPKTRYNIRLAEKRGVKTFVTREERYREAFLGLMQATADRKEITPHPRAYYEKFLAAFPEEMCRLFVAEYEGEVLAANLLMTYGTTATYLHGGSGDEHREMMAPYLLQWEQIRYAKANGCTRYDFGGVRTTNHESRITNHEKEKNGWAGITRFKTGFSPETGPVVFPGAYDIILDAKAYFLYERLRRLQESVRYIGKFLSR